MSFEIRFVTDGKEMSVDSVVRTIVQAVRSCVREEISLVLSGKQNLSQELPPPPIHEMPRQAVSIREAARLLSISPRTVDKYVALKVIRTVRVGRRVLVPMKSVNEVASKGIPWRRNQRSIGEQKG
jgi:excisionase family DNA binding protein